MEVGLIIKDQYQVVEHIGRGGMADVWSARDARLNRLVAIKTISQSLSTDADPIALFEQEAQTIAQMEHPHILPIYDFGDYRNNLYIVMRYVTGGSLEDKLEEKPLTLQETLQIGGNIAKALDYAHANNVIHLDLKPPNILMDSGGSPYLADFGLATVLDKQGRAQNPGSGTLLYMAPEQLVAEVIDHRADIYSFCVMIFHMLTGTLPFEGMIPLAIKQLQFQEQLPDIDQFISDIPYQITDVLRQGTATEPHQRQATLSEIIDQMREALQLNTIDLDSAWGATGEFGDDFGMESALTINIDDVGLLEAADIYVRAKHVWAGGNGRFLLGVSHFMMMCDYYMEAEEHGLELDDMGLQMLLRGALEYDYHIEYWWAQVNDETRRWVCLHAIRSESAPARIRALYHLETLPDDPQKPVIPNLVANALSIETNKEAKLAALNVLGTRASLLKPSQSFDIKTEFRGRLLSTTTRLGIEILPPKVWREAIYSPEIDLLIANEALNEDDDEVAETAARIIGRIHSLTALRLIANEQRQNTPNSLRALALIRDEAPYLPDVVSRQARLYAWVANTIRRITDDPMQLVFRFLFALLGGAIGFGQQVYITYRSQALFVPQRWGNTLAVGLLMGLFIAILVMFSDAIVSRLKGFWPNWLRLIFSLIFGALFGTLTWTGFTWLYLNQPPHWDLMRLGGFGLAFGLVASAMFNLKSWQSLILTASSIFLSIFAAYYNNCTQLYICFADSSFNLVEGITNFSISPIALVGFLFGSMFGVFIPRPEPLEDAPPAPLFSLTQYGGLGIILALGLGISIAIYVWVLGQHLVTWDHVILLFAIPTILSAIAIVILEGAPRVMYFLLGLLGFGIIMLQVQSALTGIDTLIAPQFGADYVDSLFAYDLYWQSLTVALPVSLVIALGAFAMGIFRDLRHFIGLSSDTKERNTWLTGVLIYVMTMSALVTVFAPFSLHAKPIWIIPLGNDNVIYDSVLWAIGWSLVGGLTLVSALATWQWKRWGAYGLIICAIIFVIGGFVADSRIAIATAFAGNSPQILNIESLIVWALWAIVTGVMTVGALRRKLWSAFGLVVMIFLWFVTSLFFNNLGSSLTAFALVHVPLIAFALRFDWDYLEDGKEKVKGIPSDTPSVRSPDPIVDEQVTIPLTADDMQTLATELDPNPVVASANELKTELDLNEALLNAANLETELDPNANYSSAGELQTELDLNEALLNATNLETELDPNANYSSAGELQTELDIHDLMNNDDLAENIDRSPMDLKTELDPQAHLNRDHTDTKQNTNKEGANKSKLKIDTSLLGAKPDEKIDNKASRKGLKIDTNLLGSKSKETDDSKSSRKGLKIDTSLLGSKPDETDDSKSSRQGLKIDPSLLNKPAKEEETELIEDDYDPDKDDTLPSRPTSKMSTSEIKKQLAEEAIRMKEEADRKLAESKPKFKLDTTRIKSDKEQNEPPKDEE